MMRTRHFTIDRTVCGALGGSTVSPCVAEALLLAVETGCPVEITHNAVTLTVRPEHIDKLIIDATKRAEKEEK